MEGLFTNLGTLLQDLTGWIIGIIAFVVVLMVVVQIVKIISSNDPAQVSQHKGNIMKILGFGVLATVVTVVVPAIFGYFQP